MSRNYQRQVSPTRLEARTSKGTIAVLSGLTPPSPSGSANPKAYHTLLGPLRKAGFLIKTDPSTTHAPVSTPDIAIIDLQGLQNPEGSVQALNDHLPAKFRPELLFLVDASMPKDAVATLAGLGTVRPVQGQTSLSPLCRQLIRFQRIQMETKRQSQAFADAGQPLIQPSPTPTTLAPSTLLIAGSPGPTALKVVRAAERFAERVICAFRPGQTLSALETAPIDGVIMMPNSASDPLNGLARAMRRHRHYRHIPIIHIKPAHDLETVFPSSEAVLLDTHIDDFLKSILHSEQFRKQQQKRNIHQLHTARKMYGDDILPEPIRARIYARYSQHLFHNADQLGYGIGYLALRISPKTGEAMNPDLIKSQIDPLFHRLIRAEDHIVCLSRTRRELIYALSFIGLLQERINNIADRLVSVTANTMFHDQNGAPLALRALTSTYDRPEGTRLEETIAGLLSGLRR